MSDQRRLRYQSGRLMSSPLTDLFALGRAPVLTLPLEGGETPYSDARPIVISLSANIAASGEATTSYGFTAPSGKTGTDFFTGRRWDDENGIDTTTITADDWTKVGWSIKLRSVVSNGTVYEFRVVADGVPLDTYTVVPTLTAGTPPTPSKPFQQSLLQRIPALRNF